MDEDKLNLVRAKLNELRFALPSQMERALQEIYQILSTSDGASLLAWESQNIVRRVVQQEGAAAIVVEALRLPQVSPRLYYRAFSVLTLFAELEADRVAESGGLQIILEGMTKYRDVEYIQQAGIVALVELSRKTSHLPIGIEPILQGVLRAVETYKHSPVVFYLSCKSFQLLCTRGIQLGSNLALRVHENLMDGIFLFLLDERAQTEGQKTLSMWVGREQAQYMIQLRASTLLTMARFLRMAMGMES